MEVGMGDQPVLAGLVTVAAWGLLESVVSGQHLSLPREAALADGAAQGEGLDLGAGVGQVGQPASGDVGDLETVVRLGADQVLGDQLEQGFAYGAGAHPVLLAELGELQPLARPGAYHPGCRPGCGLAPPRCGSAARLLSPRDGSYNI